jgi:hypothetical protein
MRKKRKKQAFMANSGFNPPQQETAGFGFTITACKTGTIGRRLSETNQQRYGRKKIYLQRRINQGTERA